MFRLFRISKRGNPETLFHSLHGSRELAFDTWLTADIKEVRNPGKNIGPTYISGFHVCPSKEETLNYLSRFKNPSRIIVCKVYVTGTRPKPRARANIYLAEQMLINKEDWEEAINEKFIYSNSSSVIHRNGM